MVRIFSKNYNNKLFFLFIFLCLGNCFAQNIVKGEITNSYNKIIPFASVLVKIPSKDNILKYTYSNEKGEFILKLEKGVYVFSFSALGFEKKSLIVEVNKKKKLTLY